MGEYKYESVIPIYCCCCCCLGTLTLQPAKNEVHLGEEATILAHWHSPPENHLTYRHQSYLLPSILLPSRQGHQRGRVLHPYAALFDFSCRRHHLNRLSDT